MPQSLAQIYPHLVFSTKDRRPFLQNCDLRNEMQHDLGGICNGLGKIRVGMGRALCVGLMQPPLGLERRGARFPGCAARPWVVRGNAFGVVTH